MNWIIRENLKVDRVAHGFSALGLADQEILQPEFVVYDALDAECRRHVAQGHSGTG